MMGFIDDAEDAVQEAWLRLSRNDAQGGDNVVNLDAWLTTAVARICLSTLRARRARAREELVAQVPDPVADLVGEFDPEHRPMLADAAGWRCSWCWTPCRPQSGWLSCCTTVPFDQIAPILDRAAEATRKLARGYTTPERQVRAATVNGAAGAVIFLAGRPTAIMGFVVRQGRITAIDVLADPARVARIEVSAVLGKPRR